MLLKEKKKESGYIFSSQHRADQMPLKQKLQEEGLFNKNYFACALLTSAHSIPSCQ